MTTRCALYLRVSTDEQSLENQRAEVEQLARARGFEPVIYEEQESAAKRRPVLEQLMDDARRGAMRAVVVWALDRLDRNMHACLSRVVELDRLGVPVVSVREPWLDTTGPTRSLLVAIFAWVAEQERAQLRARTKAGLGRVAREQRDRSGPKGTWPAGRPPASPVLLSAAADLVRAGAAIRTAARAKGVQESTLRRHMARAA